MSTRGALRPFGNVGASRPTHRLQVGLRNLLHSKYIGCLLPSPYSIWLEILDKDFLTPQRHVLDTTLHPSVRSHENSIIFYCSHRTLSQTNIIWIVKTFLFVCFEPLSREMPMRPSPKADPRPHWGNNLETQLEIIIFSGRK